MRSVAAEELSALTNIATSPSPAAEPLDSSTSATEEIGLLDNAIEQMQKVSSYIFCDHLLTACSE